MPDKTDKNSKANYLYNIFGPQVKTYVNQNFDIIKGVSLTANGSNLEVVNKTTELIVALEDAEFRSEVVEEITKYGMKCCAYAFGSATKYENYRTPAVDAAIFLRAIMDFLNPYQCSLLAEGILKNRNNNQGKEQTR